jgi:hypothetical protein
MRTRERRHEAAGMLTWIRFPDGRRIAAEFHGTLRPGTIVIIDGVEYVIEYLGQVATQQLPRSRRYGKPRRFMPMVFVENRAVGERPQTQSGGIDGRSGAGSIEPEHATNHRRQ